MNLHPCLGEGFDNLRLWHLQCDIDLKKNQDVNDRISIVVWRQNTKSDVDSILYS